MIDSLIVEYAYGLYNKEEFNTNTKKKLKQFYIKNAFTLYRMQKLAKDPDFIAQNSAGDGMDMQEQFLVAAVDKLKDQLVA